MEEGKKQWLSLKSGDNQLAIADSASLIRVSSVFLKMLGDVICFHAYKPTPKNAEIVESILEVMFNPTDCEQGVIEPSDIQAMQVLVGRRGLEAMASALSGYEKDMTAKFMNGQMGAEGRVLPRVWEAYSVTLAVILTQHVHEQTAPAMYDAVKNDNNEQIYMVDAVAVPVKEFLELKQVTKDDVKKLSDGLAAVTEGILVPALKETGIEQEQLAKMMFDLRKTDIGRA